MSKVIVTKEKLDALANSVAIKSKEPVLLTIDQMKNAVDGITVPQGSISVDTNGTVDVTAFQSVNVNVDTHIKGYFYVYCSSDCSIHRIQIPDLPNWTFDITSLVHEGWLYGGYANSYIGSSKDWSKVDLEELNFDQDGVAYDISGTAGSIHGVVSTFYTGMRGTELIPQQDAIYYLIEHSDQYCRPLILYSADSNNNVEYLLMTTCIPAGYFGGVTFLRDKSKNRYYSSHSASSSSTTWNGVQYNYASWNTINYPDKYCNLTSGMMTSLTGNNSKSYAQILLSEYDNNSIIEITPSWATLDFVQVYGKITAVINIGDKNLSNISCTYRINTQKKYGYEYQDHVIYRQTVTPNQTTQVVSPSYTQSYLTSQHRSTYMSASVVTVEPIPSQYIVPTGSKTIAQNGTGIDVAQYATVDVAVPAPSPTLQTKTATPTTSEQSITPDTGYDGLSQVTVNAIPSEYIIPSLQTKTVTPTEQVQIITADQSSTNILSSFSTTQAIYSSYGQARWSLTFEKEPIIGNTYHILLNGTRTYKNRTYSFDNDIIWTGFPFTITPTVTGSSSGSEVFTLNSDTIRHSASSDEDTQFTLAFSFTETVSYDGLSQVTVNAISDTYVGSAIPRNPARTITGPTVSIVGHAYYTGNVSTTIPSGSVSTPATTITANPSISIDEDGLITATASASQSITPSVTTGYISSGTAGTVSVSGTNTQQLTTQAAKTVTPTESEQTAVAANVYTTGIVKVEAISSTYVGSGITQRSSTDLTASGATVTVPAGYYASQATKFVASMTLPTSASSTSSGTSKATVNRSTSVQYINIPTGYNSAAAYYQIAATPNGTVTAPGSITGTAASVSTGTNTLTFTKTISVTPNVTTAGYISAGTAGNASVSLTANVTTKAAATITPGTSNQTIAAGTYLTGAQTIAGDADLVGSNIISTANIFGVQGTVQIQHVYTGTSAPSSSTGSNGDIYIQGS